MSLSKPTSTERITNKYIKFKNGEFLYYDKEKGENIPVPLPIEFVVLDELATITGWHDESESGIYSNEVHSTTKEEINVRAFKGGEIANGMYKEIKDKVKAKGGRYAKSVYAMLNDEIVNFQFVGAVLSSWINKDFKPVCVKVEKLGEGKKGATKYPFPVFEEMPTDDKKLKKAVELDKQLQDYLDSYKEAQTAESEATADDVESVLGIKYESDVKKEDLPF